MPNTSTQHFIADALRVLVTTPDAIKFQGFRHLLCSLLHSGLTQEWLALTAAVMFHPKMDVECARDADVRTVVFMFRAFLDMKTRP
jgi:hypothetical protein